MLDELRGVLDAELGFDVFLMSFDCLDTQIHRIGDLTGTETVADLFEHLQLAVGQRCDSRQARWLAVSRAERVSDAW